MRGRRLHCPGLLGATAVRGLPLVTDDSVHAAHLVRRTALAEGIATMSPKPVLHGDNGSTLKATTVLAMLY